ncbi:MAG: folate family ECF transporter S component [Mobilitalea sp.]
MRKFIEVYVSSFLEFKKLRNVVVMAMFIAIAAVLGIFFTFFITQDIKVSLVFLPSEFSNYLFGPVVGAVVGAVTDVLVYFLRPNGPFFYGFTISAVLSGLLYGTLLYKRPVSWYRILVANLINYVTINLLNTYWLSILYGNAFMVILPGRLIKGAIMLPVETILLYFVIKAVEATGVIKQLRRD